MSGGTQYRGANVMSNGKGKGNGDYEYLRAAVQQKEHTEREHNVVVRTTIRLRSSPCVLELRSEAFAKEYPETQAPICCYEASWPNVQVVSWPAFLYQSAVKLDRLVEESRIDVEKVFIGL